MMMVIFKSKFYWMLLLSLLLALVFSAEAHAVAYSDLQNHWANDAIQALTAKGVLNGYPDGSFKPDQAVTRAELSKIIAKTFAYAAGNTKSFPDTQSNWAKSFINAVAEENLFSAFPDGTFRPADPVSRAKISSMFSRILRLATPEQKFSGVWPASFSDVSADHWAFRYIEIGNKLGVYPTSYKTEFQPQQSITRAEAAWIIKAVDDLVVSKGKIAEVDPDTGLVNVLTTTSNEPLLSMIVPDTVVLRNNVSSNIDVLLAGDDATVIALPTGEVKFFKSYGKVTKNDLLSRVSSMTKGRLTSDQISAIVAGDWNTVKDDFKGGIYNRLMDMGLTPAEAESIMVRDWNYLDSLSKDRLSQALSGFLGITQDFSQALLDRDLQKIKEYGKIELATAALSRLLGAAGPPSSNESGY